jgi:hypothetical protein
MDCDEWKSRFNLKEQQLKELVEALCKFKEQGNFNKEAFEEVSEHIDKNSKTEDV